MTAEMETVVVIPCQARGGCCPSPPAAQSCLCPRLMVSLGGGVAGVPPPAMAWYKDAAPIHLEKLSRFRLQPDGSLQISGLVPDDTGMFQCFAHNDAGEVQTSTYLAVTSRFQSAHSPFPLGGLAWAGRPPGTPRASLGWGGRGHLLLLCPGAPVPRVQTPLQTPPSCLFGQALPPTSRGGRRTAQ